MNHILLAVVDGPDTRGFVCIEDNNPADLKACAADIVALKKLSGVLIRLSVWDRLERDRFEEFFSKLEEHRRDDLVKKYKVRA